MVVELNCREKLLESFLYQCDFFYGVQFLNKSVKSFVIFQSAEETFFYNSKITTKLYNNVKQLERFFIKHLKIAGTLKAEE